MAIATFFAGLGSEIEAAVSGFAESTSAALIDTLGPVVLSGVSIYFILKGVALMTGSGNESAAGVLMTGMKLVLISFFGLNAGHFTSFAIGTVSALESFLTSALPGSPSVSWAALDQIWGAGLAGYEALWALFSKASGWAAAGIWVLNVLSVAVFLFCAVFMLSAALGVLVMTKVGLVLLLGFGPFFICLLAFPWVKPWFGSWLRTVVTFVFTLVFLAAVVTFFVQIYEAMVTAVAEAAERGEMTAALWLRLGALLIVSYTFGSIVRSVPGLASSVIGSAPFHASGFGQMLHGGGVAGGTALGGALAGAGAVAGAGWMKRSGRSMLGSQGLHQTGAVTAATAGGLAAAVPGALWRAGAKYRAWRAARAAAGSAQKDE